MQPFNTKGFEHMELSTQILIKEAIHHGLEVEILDKKDNFILIKNKTKQEYIKQATKTSLDTYINILMMENKYVTKALLLQNKISTPLGKIYYTKQEAWSDYALYKAKDIVIKPNSTNFGKGVHLFKKEQTQEEFESTVKNTFLFDEAILIENFVQGREFRYLVIDDCVEGILHRTPANVIGDGIHTIKKLVELKNENPLRAKGYTAPLEKIKLLQIELDYLRSHNWDTQDIPKKDEQVFLRENSNISTGGDSIDYTDMIHPSYKQIAIEASKILGVKFCGVDIIIKDIHQEAKEHNYSILELNFNPAIHIHTFPAQGKNRNIAKSILKALKLI